MRIILFAPILLSFLELSAQKDIDAYKLPQVNFAPQIYVNGVRQVDVISLKSFREYGMQVVLDDKSFKAIQFDFGFDCHSRSFFDFSWKRYYGDKVLPLDAKIKSWV